jgi:hypothetical protein
LSEAAVDSRRSAALRAIDLEMESIEDRVKKLEGHQPQ